MAVVRTRSSPPYGLITFVSLWVVTTGLAIFFYVQWNGAAKEKDTAVNDLKLAGSTAERKQADTLYRRTANTSLLGAANDAFLKLRGLLSSSTSASAGELETDATAELKNAGKNTPMIEAVKQLARENKSKKDQLDTLSGQVDSLRTTNQAALKAAESSLAQSTKDLKDAQTALSAANAQLAAALQARDEAVKAGEDKLSQLVQTIEDQRRQSVLQLEQMKSDNDKLAKQVEDLRVRLAIAVGGVRVARVGEADGKIMTVNPAEKEVYIDLGSAANIREGMTFTVYDPRIGVRYGTQEEAQGKASIEVREVFDKSALCRITRTTIGQAIQSGDLIANLVYHASKERKFHFVVYGDFDLDGDGAATANERERLVRMILNWGGVVDNEVNTQTDYVVVGERPASPTLPVGEGDAPGSVPAERVVQQDKYDQLVGAASRLSIPVLNANRFLAMIGYYNTTIVRPTVAGTTGR